MSAAGDAVDGAFHLLHAGGGLGDTGGLLSGAAGDLLDRCGDLACGLPGLLGRRGELRRGGAERVGVVGDLRRKSAQADDHALEGLAQDVAFALRCHGFAQISFGHLARDAGHAVQIRDHPAERLGHLTDFVLRADCDFLIEVSRGDRDS
ncbi:MAG TPA: hypothetical protein PK954_03825, partial [Anaerolineales bacterium]|nr:hypothetical protein [Anaerolineales bacterium]